MPRPGFVLEVDDKTPSLLTMAGATLRMERFGVGTQVVYAADAVASSEPVGLIEAALDAPMGTSALAEKLRPETKLTLVVLDGAWPLPRPEFDVRRSLVERVLEAAARAGVDDVELVIANGLGQRWSPAQISRVLGDRVATSFLPDSLVSSHDVTAEDLVAIGEVDGHTVRINRRVAESDLAVVIGVRASSDLGCPLAAGLADAETINRIQGLGATQEFRDAVSRAMTEAVPTFALMAVLGQPFLAPGLRFASKREWEWNVGDHLAYAAARQIVAALPRQGAQLIHGDPRADYAILDIVGGEYLYAVEESQLVWRAANTVEVPKAADVLVTSVWGPTIDEGDAIGSPLNAARYALADRAGSHLDTPLVRDGGILVAFHPLRPRFSNRRQSAAADFFAKVLSETTDVTQIAQRFEPAAAADQWYLDLYRKQFSDHPLRVFHDWYRVAAATARLSDVIWVGGDRRTAALLGHRAATTYADALEIASNVVGSQPVITALHGPGLTLGDVR